MHKTRHLNGDRISVQLAVLMGKAGYLALQKEPAGCLPRPAPITGGILVRKPPKVSKCFHSAERWYSFVCEAALASPAGLAPSALSCSSSCSANSRACTSPVYSSKLDVADELSSSIPSSKGSAGARCPQGP